MIRSRRSPQSGDKYIIFNQKSWKLAQIILHALRIFAFCVSESHVNVDGCEGGADGDDDDEDQMIMMNMMTMT